jgi:adenosylcobinamide-GDP ribazoletransferase
MDEWAPWLGARAEELSAAIHFLTRLPLPRHAPASGPVLANAAWAFPLAGIVVGLIGAVIYALAHRLGLTPLPAAGLALAGTLAVTGALHEDGLADTADGFGGGDTAERKLDIMRDSRIGSFGVCALILSLLLRAAALASIADTTTAAAALIAANGAARAILPAVMYLLPPARTEGLSFSAGQPSSARVIIAAVIGLIILGICLGPVLAIIAAVVLAIVLALMAWLAAEQIGGQTGDVIGAVEQVAEIAVLLVAVA